MGLFEFGLMGIALLLLVLFPGQILGRLGIAGVWLVSFGRIRLRPDQRREDGLTSVGCGFLFGVVIAVLFRYGFKSA